MTFNCPGQGVSDLPGAKFQPGPWVLILTGVGAGAGDFWSRFGTQSDLLKL